MADLTVSADIDSFMQSVNKAAAASFLGALTTTQIAGLATTAPAALATTAVAGVGTFAAREDHQHVFPTAAQIGAVAKSGDTMTGKLTAAATSASALLNIGAALPGAGPSSVADGDLWISNQNKLSFRTGGNTVNAAGLSQANTYSQPQIIGSTSNAAPVLSVGNTGTREAIVATAQGTSPAVRITQTGTGEALRVEDETNPDATPFVVNASGRVGIGVSLSTSETSALTVDSGGIKFSDGSVQTAFLAPLTTSQIAGLSTAAGVAITTSGVAGLSNFAARADHSHAFTSLNIARTKVVGQDASTIQGCIDLITDASSSNPAQVLVPPGVYNENLTFKGCVLVAAVANNNGLSGTVRVNGTHTFVGGATASDNQLQINGLYLIGSNATTPTLSLTTATGVTSLVYIEDCYIASGSSQTTAVGVYVGPDVILRVNNVRSGAYSVAGSGGTHFDINGGSLYANGLTTEYGTCAILARGTNGALKPYCQLINSLLSCSGANVVNITSATALFTVGWSSLTNLATTGNGFSIAAGSVIGVYNSSFAIVSGASNYIATGAAGSYYYSFANNYSNATGVSYETKVDTNVTQFLYSSSTYCTGSKTFDTPSLAAGASTTTTVTCTGATTSHFAEATLSTNTGASGLTITAYVSAANTVTVRLTNQTASPVDLASGTLKVRTSL